MTEQQQHEQQQHTAAPLGDLESMINQRAARAGIDQDREQSEQSSSDQDQQQQST